MNHLVSFIVVEYHSKDDIDSFLYFISSSLKLEFEVIISSNSGYDEKAQKEILRNYPTVKWLFNPCNGGFAYAMNEGLKVANGNFLAIVNPDVRITMDLSEMVEFLKSHNNVGGIAPKILNYKNEIQDSFRQYITVVRFLTRNLKRIYFGKSVILDKYNYSEIQSVDWVIGAFIMVKREAYSIAGGLDDKYFLYCEDMDWCTSIRKVGFEIVYYPNISVIYEGTRSARKSFQYLKIFVRSLFRYWGKFGYFRILPKREDLFSS